MSDELMARLRAAGCVYAEEEAALLREAATGEGGPHPDPDPGRLEVLVRRRVAGEPLEPLLGWAGLDGLRVVITPGVFVPRTRTLLLVDLAEQALDDRRPAAPGRDALVVDLCCGSGALAAVLRRRRPGLDVHAADLDPDAVACARLNLPADRVHEGDLYDALPTQLRGRVDVLVVNAPYVPTAEIALMPPEARDHERRLALDGGADGLDVHRRVADGATRWLAPGGALLVEVAPAQVPAAVALLAAAGLDVDPARDVVTDATRDATAVRARRVAHARDADGGAPPGHH